MKRSRVVLSIVLVLTMLTVTVLPTFAESVTVLGVDNSGLRSSKIDKELKHVMETMSDDSIVPVTIWFYNAEKTVFRTSLTNSINKYGLNSDSNIIVDDISQLNDDSFKSVSAYQKFSHVFRESRRNVYERYNTSKLNELIQNYHINPTIIYKSVYTPSIILSITKSDLIKIQYDENIEVVYFHHDDAEAEDETEGEIELNENRGQRNRDSFPYGYWQHSTNIDTLRYLTGATGAGVIVGLVENGHPDLSLPIFEDAVNNNRITCLCTNTDGHASLVASVLTGETSDYLGVAPNVNLICTNYQTSWEYTLETLITYDVSIINISLTTGASSSYDDISKLFDYIVYFYGITICKAAENYAPIIYGGALSYNIISVGNIDDKNTMTINDDEIDGTSSYSSGNTAYKPDISAPGKNNKNPVDPNLYFGGTSCATPLVAGVCALLMEEFPTLKHRPMVLKSALMASAHKMFNMTDIYSNPSSVDPALDRKYGAGMIDAYAAYQLLNNNRYLSVKTEDSMASPTNTLELVVHSCDITNEKSIFATVNWMQGIITLGTLPNYTGYAVLPIYHHELRLYDPQGNLVARSTYTYDRKQFIRYKPTQAGTYTLTVYKTGTLAYYPQSAIAYSIYHP